MAALTLDVRRLIGRLSIHSAGHVGRISFLVLEMFRGLAEWRVWLPRTFEQAQNIGLRLPLHCFYSPRHSPAA